MQTQTSPTVKELTHAYGLDARFYSLWLDPYLTYSCANWDAAPDLAAAQRNKLDAALDSLQLPAGGSMLDVGCGWGSLLRRGSERGYRVKGLVPVASQAAFCAEQGYDVLDQSWQNANGNEIYDGIASIGAFEHFATRKASPAERAEQYRRYFAWAAQHLHEGGRMYLQTICFLVGALADPGQVPKDVALAIVRKLRPVRMEWPSSMLPMGLGEILAAADPYFEVISVRARRSDYARTCACWLERLTLRREEALALVGEATIQRFESYLSTASPAFDQGLLTLYQLVFSKRASVPELLARAASS